MGIIYPRRLSAFLCFCAPPCYSQLRLYGMVSPFAWDVLWHCAESVMFLVCWKGALCLSWLLVLACTLEVCLLEAEKSTYDCAQSYVLFSA